jgi:peptide/nickel transport system ATP-binding protein
VTPLLDVRGLTVRYGGEVTAVRDVSFTLQAGQALGVVGESGSGKSSIAGAVLGLLGAHARIEGAILFEGQDLATLAAPDRRAILGSRIGSVFQDPFTALNPSLRIGRQIAEPLVQHTRLAPAPAARRAVELLAEVGIARPAEDARAYPHQLSGGMRQRAWIARRSPASPGC